MESLNENWLTEGLIDFEYKKYVLLAYLKNVKTSFQRVELYPFLADLVFHYRNLMALKENKSVIFDQFPKQLSLDNLRKLEVNYKKIIEDDAIMKEIESIIEFSLPQLKTSLDEGSFIYDYVESKCEISPVGLTSLYSNEGYLFIAQPPQKETDIYRYQVTIFDNSNEQLRGIHTHYLLRVEKKLEIFSRLTAVLFGNYFFAESAFIGDFFRSRAGAVCCSFARSINSSDAALPS